MINELKDEIGKEKLAASAEDHNNLSSDIKDFIGDKLIKAYNITDKQDRVLALDHLYNEICDKFINEEQNINDKILKKIFKKLSQIIVRNDVLENGVRIDGRKTNEIRNIEIEVGLLPNVHGCALLLEARLNHLLLQPLAMPKIDN